MTKKKSTKEIICIFLTLSILLFCLFLFVTHLTEIDIENKKFVNRDYSISKGIVSKKSTYKGRSIHVRYLVKGKTYEESAGISEKDNISEGDSIIIKYSNTKPELMITEFDEQF